MLVELSVVEQRLRAVLEVVQDRLPVVEVAERYGVSRQAVHAWLRRYAAGGLAALADRSHRPTSCPHQMPKPVEARLLELRERFPEWGPIRLRHQLAQEGVVPLPGRTSIYRALRRNQLVLGARRRPRRADDQRWERDQPMELWQLDIMGGIPLADGTECKLISGVDDASRYCVLAHLVLRPTGRAVVEAFLAAMSHYGLPAEVLTDNGKQFTGRFGRNPAEVLFERTCRHFGITHRKTGPRAPTTTGKVERFHRTLRTEFLAKQAPFATLQAAQTAVDRFVADYNTTRPHQALTMAPPAARFRPATPPKTPLRLSVLDQAATARPATPRSRAAAHPTKPTTRPATRTVDRKVTAVGVISYANTDYNVGRAFAGHLVQVTCVGDIVQIRQHGELLRAWPRRHPPAKDATIQPHRSDLGRLPLDQAAHLAPLDDLATDPGVVRRLVDPTGSVSFAGCYYHAGRGLTGHVVQVRCVNGVVQLILDGDLVGAWRQRHTPTQQQRMIQRPNPQQRTANTRPLTSTVNHQPDPPRNQSTGP